MGRYDARIKQYVTKVTTDTETVIVIAGTSVPCIVGDQSYTETGEGAGSRVLRAMETDILLDNLNGITVDVGTLGTFAGDTYRIHEPKTTHSNGNVVRITWGAE